MPPGTLYQFYANKEALAEGYAERLRSLHERVFSPRATTTPLQELVDVVVDPFLREARTLDPGIAPGFS